MYCITHYIRTHLRKYIGRAWFIWHLLSIQQTFQAISITLRVVSSIHSTTSPLSDGTVYPKKYAHGFCFAVLCCGYTLTDFPISIRLTSLAMWQSNDCPSASKATLMNMDKYFMWIHYERLHNHNKAKHNKTVCIFLGIYCICKCKLYVLLADELRKCYHVFFFICVNRWCWSCGVGFEIDS